MTTVAEKLNKNWSSAGVTKVTEQKLRAKKSLPGTAVKATCRIQGVRTRADWIDVPF